MKKNSAISFLLLILAISLYCNQKKPVILYTAALIKHKYRSRKQEYLQSLKILDQYGYTPYIIESIAGTKKRRQEKTFFDKCNTPLLYTKSNNPYLRNKGVNECISLKKAFSHYNFDDNEMIVKLTGRYFFTSDAFLRTIEEHPEVDAWVKICSNGFAFTGCFALRAKYFRQLLTSIDYKQMECNMICEEELVAQFIETIKLQGAHIGYVDTLHLTASLFFTGNTQLTYQ